MVSTEQIEWKDIPGFPGYRISNFGQVETCFQQQKDIVTGKFIWIMTTTWKSLTSWINKRNNRHYYTLVNNKYKKHFQRGRLVLLSFIGPPPSTMECCHNDNNYVNDVLDNIRWDTRKGNFADKKKHGTWQGGEKANGAKLCNNDILEIRALANDGMSHRQIAKLKHVTKSTIGSVLRGKSWTHV